MGSGRVSGHPSDFLNDGVTEKSVTPFPYTDIFNKHLPYYMAIGMSYDDFWHGDPCMVTAYREAQEIRNEMRNQELWLQGAYIYKVLEAYAPILPAFPKKGARVGEYCEPIKITRTARERDAEEKAKEVSDAGIAKMKAFGKKFRERHSITGGDE